MIAVSLGKKQVLKNEKGEGRLKCTIVSDQYYEWVKMKSICSLTRWLRSLAHISESSKSIIKL